MNDTDLPLPRRRPVRGGYARGDETRERVLLAAMRVFAKMGFQKASTRRIAAEAGLTPPVLQYHFDSKEGLHRACGELLVERVKPRLAPALERARLALEASDPARAVDALCDLVLDLAGLVMGEANDWLLFMARADSFEDGPAHAILEEEIAAPVMRMTICLVACALGLPSNSEEARLRALLIANQASIHRQRTLTLLGWSDFNPHAIKTIQALLTDSVRRQLA